MATVANCNRVLAAANLASKVLTPEDALKVCSTTSVLTAATEAMIGRRIEGVARKPRSVEHRTHNVQCVLNELASNVLQTDLSHISATRVANGDPRDVKDILEILAALANVMPSKRAPEHAPPTAPLAFDPPTTTAPDAASTETPAPAQRKPSEPAPESSKDRRHPRPTADPARPGSKEGVRTQARKHAAEGHRPPNAVPRGEGAVRAHGWACKPQPQAHARASDVRPADREGAR